MLYNILCPLSRAFLQCCPFHFLVEFSITAQPSCARIQGRRLSRSKGSRLKLSGLGVSCFRATLCRGRSSAQDQHRTCSQHSGQSQRLIDWSHTATLSQSPLALAHLGLAKKVPEELEERQAFPRRRRRRGRPRSGQPQGATTGTAEMIGRELRRVLLATFF